MAKEVKSAGENDAKYSQHQEMFDKMKEIITQNVNKTKNKSFTAYTKDLIKQYMKNPYNNIDNIRAVSAFLERYSMLYKKILSYFAQMPLFYYNIVFRADLTKGVDYNQLMKEYQTLSTKLQEIDMQKEFSVAIATALRDGVYYGFIYDGDGDGFFIDPLDPKYCKISGITGDGEYIFAFDASYFNSGNNIEYLYGINNDGEGTWDQVFIDGYEAYTKNGYDYRWFELPPEKTICLLADDDPDMPLPYFMPIFISLLDLLDLEQIIASKSELENYKLLLSKIPLIPNTDEVDDFAVSLDFVKMTQELINEAVPDLVGTVYSPCDLEVIDFDKANSTEDTDALSKSINNLFKNLGVSELVVSSGSSTNSVGLRQSIKNDESLAFKYLERLQTWINAYIKANYTENFIFKFHRITYFSQEEYIDQLQGAATLGLPVATDMATALGQTPYEMMCETFMENALGIKDGLWKPLSSSYTQSGSNDESPGRPLNDDDDLTEEGIATRDGNKNDTGE